MKAEAIKASSLLQQEANRILRPKKAIKVTSDIEATRYAKSILRYVNKEGFTGFIKENILLEYAAASVVNITTDRESLWNGPVFVTHIRHDYVAQKSKLFLEKFWRDINGRY